jgi:hypothetical protein
MTPSELVATACPKIGALGSAFYFVPETTSRGKERGVDGMRLYFLGRGGVLGDTSAAVVRSAFGYFNPGLVEKMWNSGREKLPATDAAALYWEACADFGRAKLPGIDGLDGLVAALDQVNDSADPSGLALYAGIKQLPLVDDAPGRAMQLIAKLREFRGSAHLVAVRAVGLDDTHAHFITRPEMVAGFGWTDADAAGVTDDDKRLLEQAEQVTDVIVTPAFAALDGDGATALVDGLTAAEAALTG